MNNLQLQLYAEQLKAMRIGKKDGCPPPSKPILMLSIIHCISTKDLQTNHIAFSNQSLQVTFFVLYGLYLKVLPEYDLPLLQGLFSTCHPSPSTSLFGRRGPVLRCQRIPHLRNSCASISYAKLDEDLWALLQEAENREYLRKVIIDQYLK